MNWTVHALGFDLSEFEKGKSCSTYPKFDFSDFDISVVNLHIQRATCFRSQMYKKKKKRENIWTQVVCDVSLIRIRLVLHLFLHHIGS